MRIRVIRGICVLSFVDGSVILCLVVVWGLRRRREFNIFIVINIRRKTDDQPQRAPSGIHYVRKICVNLCKSVSKKRLRDTDYTDFTDYNVVISVSSEDSVVFLRWWLHGVRMVRRNFINMILM